jgi:hypothetical protein
MQPAALMKPDFERHPYAVFFHTSWVPDQIRAKTA